MVARLRIEGVDKAEQRLLSFLHTKVRRRAVRKATSKSANLVSRKMRRRVPVGRTRKLKKSIRKKTKTNKRMSEIRATVQARAPHAIFVGSGTAPHAISASGASLVIDGRFVGKRVQHPGSRGTRFGPQVASETANQVTAEYRKQMKAAVRQV